jgi:hypothetical protein
VVPRRDARHAVQTLGDARIAGLIAGVAQLVEQRIRNAKVNSSIPFTGTTTSAQARASPGLFASRDPLQMAR